MAAVLRVMSVAHPTLGAVGRAWRPNAQAGRPQPLNLPDWLRAALAGTGKPIPFGSLALRNHLAVREILRTDSGLREQYAATKEILAAAGLTDAERAAINANQVPPHDEIPK
jgi:hypothetical protein